jgi:hypothetical protein
VRWEAPPLTLVHAVQKQLAAVNPDQQIYSMVRDLETWITDLPEWQQEHLAAWIFGILAGLALALAAVGLYQRGVVRGGSAHERVWDSYGVGRVACTGDAPCV